MAIVVSLGTSAKDIVLAHRTALKKTKDDSLSSSARLSNDAQPKESTGRQRNSLLSDTDDEEGSDNASDSSEEKGTEMLRELDRQSSLRTK
jgi:hypothetical protein